MKKHKRPSHWPVPTRLYKLQLTKPDQCWKKKKINGPKGKCCCNCEHHYQINGHPWVTGTSIMDSTGLYVCALLGDDGGRKAFTLSHKHGCTCEEWTKRK